MYDAFCPAAAGARYPSEFAQNTSTFQSRSVITVVTGTGAGNSLIVISPDVTDLNAIAVNSNTGTITLPGAYIANDSTLTAWLALMKNVRIVSAGARFIPQAAATTAAGLMTIGVSPQLSPTGTWATGNALTLVQEAQLLNTTEEFVWTCKPRSKTAYDLQSQANASGTVRSGSWDALVFQVVGTASTTYGTLEYIINYEGEPSTISSASTQTLAVAGIARPDPVARAAIERMRSTIGSVFNGTVRAFSNYVQTKAANAVTGLLMATPYGRAAATGYAMIANAD